jgi:hypothetical protein
MTAASLGTDESDAPYFQTPRGGMKNSRDSMGAACNWQSAIRGLHFVTGSHQQTAEEYRRRFPLMAADQEELAENFANEHESRTKRNDRLFRSNLRLSFWLIASC